MRLRMKWLGLAVVIAITALFWITRATQNSVPATPIVQTAVKKLDVEVVAAGAATPPQVPIVIDTSASLETLMQSELPSPKLPLKDTYAALLHNANAGDHRAACRLGMEFSRCSEIPFRLAFQNRNALISSQRPKPHSTESAEQFNARVARFLQYSTEAQTRTELELDKLRLLATDCAAFQVDADLNRMQWLLTAAKAGNPTAQAELISDDKSLPHMAITRPELLQEFVRLAPDILRNRAQNGEKSAARKLAAIYAPFANDMERPTWLSHVIKPDPVLARAYLRLAQLSEAQTSPGFFAAFMPAQAGQQLNYQNDRHSQERLMFDAGLSHDQIQASETLAQEMFNAASAKFKARRENDLKQFARFDSEPEDFIFMRRCELTEPSEK